MLDPLPINPFTTPVSASVSIPGSKSITNRALIIAALADGESTLENCLFSEDTEIMVDALIALGFEIDANSDAKTIRVLGQGGRIPNKKAKLYVGNSGTSARFLTAFCCLQENGEYEIDGVEQMRKRPIESLAQSLNEIGATIETSGGFFPLKIKANGLTGGETTIDATSSTQFISALIMAAPYAKAALRIKLSNTSVRRGYIDITISMLEQFGYRSENFTSTDSGYEFQPQQPLQAKPSGYLVEGDASAASYFFALPVAIGGEIEICGITKNSLQGDLEFHERMVACGATVEWSDRSAICRFDRNAGKPKPYSGSFYSYSDTFLTAAALAPLLDGSSTIEGIEHTRHQECDRIAAMADGLQRLGQNAIETPTSLEIKPQALTPGTVDTYHDHRVAMSFGILGCYDALGNGQPWLKVIDPTCCKKTFPEFFQVLEDARESSRATA